MLKIGRAWRQPELEELTKGRKDLHELMGDWRIFQREGKLSRDMKGGWDLECDMVRGDRASYTHTDMETGPNSREELALWQWRTGVEKWRWPGPDEGHLVTGSDSCQLPQKPGGCRVTGDLWVLLQRRV